MSWEVFPDFQLPGKCSLLCKFYLLFSLCFFLDFPMVLCVEPKILGLFILLLLIFIYVEFFPNKWYFVNTWY